MEIYQEKVTPVVMSSLKKELPLSELDGITLWDKSRFQEEDLEDIPQMAISTL